MRIVSASMAMSWVAEAMAITIAATQKAVLAGGTTPSTPSAAARAASAPNTHVRYVPMASTSGAQKTFSVQAMPTLLRSPMVESGTLATLR
jgi:hypothetical protein